MDSCKSYLNKHFNATIQENWPFTVQNEQSSLIEIKTVPVRGVRNFSAKFWIVPGLDSSSIFMKTHGLEEKTCRKQICKTSRQRKNKDHSRSRKVASSNERQNDFSRIANPISYEYANLTHLQLFKEKIKNKTIEGKNDAVSYTHLTLPTNREV